MIMGIAYKIVVMTVSVAFKGTDSRKFSQIFPIKYHKRPNSRNYAENSAFSDTWKKKPEMANGEVLQKNT